VLFAAPSFPQVSGELLLRDVQSGAGESGKGRNPRPGKKMVCGPPEPQAVAQSCTLLTARLTVAN